MKCIRSYIDESSRNEDYYNIVELCYIYLLQLYVTNPTTVIQSYTDQSNELLHFLFESLFSPNYNQLTPGSRTLVNSTISLEMPNQDMDYIQSLFALICYNSRYIRKISFFYSILFYFILFYFILCIGDQPQIAHAASIVKVCQSLNTIHNLNTVIFLHQFLYFCISKYRLYKYPILL